jgi:acetyl-CoA carboxylase biotin carboxylase subunit
VLALGERDCSVQRRHQKVAEETPSPGVSAALREQMLAAAVRAGQAVGYQGAGTVECLVDTDAGSFVFLEMNTRLQVEHPVTELVTGIDLVEQQFLIAAGQPPSFDPAAVTPQGHALELRIYAEDPIRFLPGPGRITLWDEPEGDGIRVDAGYEAGNTVTPFYDPLLAKLCVYGADREQALDRARDAVAAFAIAGPKTNLAFHAELLTSTEFVSGDYDTSLISRLRPQLGNRQTGAAVAEIRAEMVANVWKVVAAEGDHVDDGDTLVILESMKMEIPVLAESAGTVTTLHVAEGDVVQEGDLIAEIG